MKKTLLIFLLLFSFSLIGKGQTLVPGDIAFVAYNSEETGPLIDNFSFVTLIDIPAGEVIFFTDNEEDSLTAGEGTIRWTSPVGGVSCGTIITITTTPSATIGSVSETLNLNFSGSGDNLIAYQGSAVSPTFIAALSNDGGSWGGPNDGDLPAGLVEGTTAIAIDPEIDNTAYVGPTNFSDSGLANRYLNNNIFWSGDDSAQQAPPTSVSIASCITTNDCDISFAVNSESCSPDNATYDLVLDFSIGTAIGTFTFTSDYGTISPATLSSNGQITISGIPSGQQVIVDATDGTGCALVEQFPPGICACYDMTDGGNFFDVETPIPNSDGDTWVYNAGAERYEMNGYCGAGCEETIESWLLFGPLDLTSTTNFELVIDATRLFGTTDLDIVYTNQYVGCVESASNNWVSVGMLTDPGTGITFDLSAATSDEVYVGIKYYDEGTDGSGSNYESWFLNEVYFRSNDTCPTINPSPTTTSVTIDNSTTSFCIGDNVNISTTVTGASPFDYSWTGPNGFTSTANNLSITNFSATDAGTYTLQITDDCGNTATDNITITAVTPPNAGTLSINPSSPICFFDNNTVQATTNGDSGGTWSSSNTGVATINSSTGEITKIANGTTTINYEVTGTSPCANAISSTDITIEYCGFGEFASAVQLFTDPSPAPDPANDFWDITGEGINNISGDASGNSEYEDPSDFGSYEQNSEDFRITGAEIKTFKNPATANVCSARMFYRVYPTSTLPGDEPGYEPPINLPFLQDCDGSWTCQSGDQKWGLSNINIEDLTDLCPDTYRLDIYYEYTGSNTSTTNCNTPVIKTIGSAGSPFTNTYTITAQTLDFDIDPNPATFCQGDEMTFTASNQTGGTSPYTMTVTYVPLGISVSGSAGQTSVTITDSDAPTGDLDDLPAGTYPFEVTMEDSCGTVSAPLTVNVTIEDRPNAGTNGTLDLCEGDTLTDAALFAQLGGTPDTGGSWSPAIVSPVTTSTTYTYTVTGTGTCADATAQVTVNVSPAPDAGTLTATASPICLGDNTQSVSSDGDAGGTWSSSNTSVLTIDSSGNITTVGAGTATVTYEVAATAPCTESSTATINITVTDAPNAGVLTATENPICLGDNTQSVSSDGDAGGTWSSSNTSVLTIDSSGNITTVGAGTATVTYTITGTGGCTNSSSTIDITINSTPTTTAITFN